MSGHENVPAWSWQEWSEQNDAIILDVREPGEWELGTLPGSKLVSMGELIERLDEFDEDTPILCVCRSGARSGQVASYLAAQGYRTANLVGGVKALGMQD